MKTLSKLIALLYGLWELYRAYKAEQETKAKLAAERSAAEAEVKSALDTEHHTVDSDDAAYNRVRDNLINLGKEQSGEK